MHCIPDRFQAKQSRMTIYSSVSSVGVAGAKVKPIGRGAVGCIYPHNSKHRGFLVARKMIAKTSAFEVEKAVYEDICALRKSSKLSKYILQYYGSGAKDGVGFLDLEIAKCDLHQLAMKKDGTLTGCPELADAFCVNRAIVHCLKGLVFLHETAELAHNDIKPSNLLFFSNGGVKIGDLGLCTKLDDCRTFGTLGYVAPEIYDDMFEDNSAVGSYATLGKSDVFGLGVSLFFIIEGQAPYKMPYTMQYAFQQYCHADGDMKRLYRESLSRNGKSFFENDYSAKVPVPRNVNELSAAAGIIIGVMCQPYATDRLSAADCLQRFPEFYRVTTSGPQMRNYPGPTAYSQAGRVSARTQNRLAVRENAPDDNPFQRAVRANVFADFADEGVLMAADALLNAFRKTPAIPAAQTNNTIVISSTASPRANGAANGGHGTATDAAQFGEWQRRGDPIAGAVDRTTLAETGNVLNAAPTIAIREAVPNFTAGIPPVPGTALDAAMLVALNQANDDADDAVDVDSVSAMIGDVQQDMPNIVPLTPFMVARPFSPVAMPEPVLTATSMLERLAADALDAKTLDQLRAKIANDAEKVALLEQLRDRPVSNAELSELGKLLLRLVFDATKPFLKMQRHKQVFMMLTNHGTNWWKASKLVSKYRRESDN